VTEVAEPDWTTIEDLFRGLAVEVEEPPRKWPETTPIIVDSREPDEAVNWLKTHRGVPVEVQQLEDEDYLIGDVHITRKTFSDFLGSLESGHFHDELTRLLLHNTKVKFILEKGILNRRGNFLYGRLLEAADSLNDAIPIKTTNGLDGTVDYLVKLRKRIIDGKFGVIRRRPVIYGHVNPFVTYYRSLPGVGTGIAEQLATRFKTPIQFADAIRDTYAYRKARWKTQKLWRTERWDHDIRGIGEERAEAIAAFILDGEYVE
jgi:ERCC4-type nuclease